MSKKVSIVLPVYNGEKRVSKSINSVIAQTYEDWELIIVNDCSTDNTLAIISEFSQKDSRIKVVNNEINQKLPRSLNIGFSVATGDYFTWTSDDNAYKPEAISVMSSYLDSNNDVDLVCCDFQVVKLDGTYISTTNLPDPDDLKYRNTVGACFMYRKELADKIGGYDPDLFLAEDYEYWIRAYLNGNIHHIKEVLYDYGWHDGSLSVTRQMQVLHKTFEVKQKHFSELLEKCNTQEEKNKFYWNMLNLLTDREEEKAVRNEYYAIDSLFKKADSKKRICERFKQCFGVRVIRKIRNRRS